MTSCANLEQLLLRMYTVNKSLSSGWSISKCTHFNLLIIKNIFARKKKAAKERLWKRAGVVVMALYSSFEGQWFEAWPRLSCCYLRQETLLHHVSLHPGV